MFRSKLLFILVLIAFSLPMAAQSVSFYQTTQDMSQKLQSGTALTFGTTGSGSQTITVDDSKTYQQVEGFGASFTDSAAWLVYTKLTADQRTQLMQQLFDRQNGIALGFLRQPMGASDLAVNFYTYDDMPTGQTDPTLANFSISHDQAYILPVLQQALAINPKVKIMATPWSPPAWMKNTGSLWGVVNGTNSTLRSDAYQPLANYFVKFIQGYQAAGVNVDYLSMQNEPLYAPPGYTGMLMSATEQMNLLNNYLAPALHTANIKTKVMLYDHNWDAFSYPTTEIADATTLGNSAGVAWHHYAGDPAAMSNVHDKAPSLSAWVTEASGGDWQTGNVLVQEGTELVNVMRNWARGYVLWSMAQDQDRGPYATTPDGQHGCGNCRGIMKVTWDKTGSGAPSSFVPELDYYVLGHASKFLQPGAFHIYSDQNASTGLYNVAFRNPDGSIVMYVVNSSGADINFSVKFHGQYATPTVKAGSIATLVWTPTQTSTVSVSPSPNGLTVTNGQSGTVGLTVQPLSGTPTVTFSCTVVDTSDAATTKASCSVSPASIAFSDSNPQNATLTVNTVKTSAAQHRRPPAGLLFSLAACTFGGVIVSARAARKAALLGILLLILCFSMSCGGGGGSTSTTPVTPPPPPATTGPTTYYALVTATPDSGTAVTVQVQVLVN